MIPPPIDRASGSINGSSTAPTGPRDSPWRIRSEDGRVDLTFTPEGYRAQTIDLKVISSRYLQPFGTFSGQIDGVAIEGLPGVTEDHAARW